jgi:hypothetical protein
VTPEEIIAQARELDPSFTQQRHPNRVAINFLSRLQRRLVGEWAKHEETSNVETYVVTFPLADFDAGELLVDPEESVASPLPITAIQRPLDMFVRGCVEPVDLDLIRWGDRNRYVNSRAAYLVESTLHFTGHVEDYNDVLRVEFTYTPTPAAIAGLAEPLILPITAEDVVVSWLGAFFARRMNEKELARPRREYLQEALDAEALWIDELQRREGATLSRIRETW